MQSWLGKLNPQGPSGNSVFHPLKGYTILTHNTVKKRFVRIFFSFKNAIAFVIF